MQDPYFDHLVETNDRFADQIKIADQKAAYIFTFLLALLVWSSEARRAFTFSHYGTLASVSTAVSVVLAAAIMTALIAAVLVVLPRSARGQTFLYWSAWPEAGERLKAARRSTAPEFLFEEYYRNAETLAVIARKKYRLVRVAFLALLVTVVAYAGLLATL